MTSASRRKRARLSGSSARLGLDFLEGHLAVQLPVEGHGDLSDRAPRQGPEQDESPGGRRPAVTLGGPRRRRVAHGRVVGRDVRHGGMEIRVGDLAEGHRRPTWGRGRRPGCAAARRRASPRVRRPAIPAGHDGRRPAPALPQDPAQGPVLVQDPGVHGADQGIARDEIHLQRQDAEQQVEVGVRLGHHRPREIHRPSSTIRPAIAAGSSTPPRRRIGACGRHRRPGCEIMLTCHRDAGRSSLPEAVSARRLGDP